MFAYVAHEADPVKRAAYLALVGVRHEVAQVAVVTAISEALTAGIAESNPMFCHRYSFDCAQDRPTEACVIRKIIPTGVLVGCEALGL